MPYDSELTDKTGLNEDQIEDATKAQKSEEFANEVFYEGMSPSVLYNRLNDMYSEFQSQERESTKQDTRSLKDLLTNRNSINPGHKHNLEDVTPTQITSNQNNYDTLGYSWLRLSTDASRTITGFTGGAKGRVLYITNVGSNDIVLADESTSSTAANRITAHNSANFTLLAEETVKLVYDDTTLRWRIVGKAIALDDLSDVTITSATTGDHLNYNGSGWVNAPAYIIGSFKAGENISAADPVSLFPAEELDTEYDEANVDTDRTWGDHSDRTYVTMGFTPTRDGLLMAIQVYLKKSGSPTDNVRVSIYSGSPTQLLTGPFTVVAGSSVTTSYALYKYQFTDPIKVTGSTQYWIVLSRSTAVDASNYYVWGYDNAASDSYTGGKMMTGNASFTFANVQNETSAFADAAFHTWLEDDDDSQAPVIKKTLGSSKILVTNHIGFANAAITSGNTGIVNRFPSQSSLSSLIPGRAMYIQDDGTLGVEPGTFRKLIGVAASTTKVEQVVGVIPTGLAWEDLGSLTWSSSSDTKTIEIPAGDYDFILCMVYMNSGATFNMRLNGISSSSYNYRYFDSGTAINATTGQSSLLLGTIGAAQTSFGSFLITGKETGVAGLHVYSQIAGLSRQNEDSFINGNLDTNTGDLATVSIIPSTTVSGKARFWGLSI